MISSKSLINRLIPIKKYNYKKKAIHKDRLIVHLAKYWIGHHSVK